MATAMQTRANTPARWQAALRRALEEGVEVLQLVGCGMWIATSSSCSSTAYEVTPWECECHAGQFGDPICKHRAALRVRLGWLVPEPEPTPPAEAVIVACVAEERCHTCDGDGWFYAETFYGPIERMTCWTCGGSGVEPVPAAA